MRTIGRIRCPLSLLAASMLSLTACGGSSGGSSASDSTPSSAARATSTTTTPVTSTAATSPSSGVGEVAAVTGSNTVSATQDGVTASMHPHSHNPVVEVPWPISFTVTRNERPLQASVSYEYLFDGQVVARRSHYTFQGHFSDVFKWPARAVGYPLTFRAVIEAAGTVIDLDYPVQVVK